MGNNGILGVLGNFITGLLGMGSQGNAAPMDLSGLGEGMADMSLQELQNSNQLQSTIGQLTPDTSGGIFGQLGAGLGKNFAPLGGLYFGTQALREQQKNNERAYGLAQKQDQRAADFQNLQAKSWLFEQQDRDRMRAYGAAPLRQIGRDGKIRTTGESQGFHLPYNEATDRYKGIA